MADEQSRSGERSSDDAWSTVIVENADPADSDHSACGAGQELTDPVDDTRQQTGVRVEEEQQRCGPLMRALVAGRAKAPVLRVANKDGSRFPQPRPGQFQRVVGTGVVDDDDPAKPLRTLRRCVNRLKTIGEISACVPVDDDDV